MAGRFGRRRSGAARSRIAVVLSQLVSELVEMHRALQCELLLGFQNVFLGDWAFPILPVPGTGSVAPGVHQPRLAAGLGPHAVNRLNMERLASLGGVLPEQALDLGFREVALA